MKRKRLYILLAGIVWLVFLTSLKHSYGREALPRFWI